MGIEDQNTESGNINYEWYCPRCGYTHATPYCPRDVLAPIRISLRDASGHDFDIEVCPYCRQLIKK